jgi:hypothetical protein
VKKKTIILLAYFLLYPAIVLKVQEKPEYD